MRDTDTAKDQPTDLRTDLRAEIRALSPYQLRQALYYLLGYDRDTAELVIEYGQTQRP